MTIRRVIRNKNYLENGFKGEDSNNQIRKNRKEIVEREDWNKICFIFVFYFVGFSVMSINM